MLLALGPDGALVRFDDAVAAARFAAYRDALQTGALSLWDVAAREGLALAPERLAYWAHWITPLSRPRRFNTRFFLAVMPPGGSAPLRCRNHRRAVGVPQRRRGRPRGARVPAGVRHARTPAPAGRLPDARSALVVRRDETCYDGTTAGGGGRSPATLHRAAGRLTSVGSPAHPQAAGPKSGCALDPARTVIWSASVS